MRLQAMQESLLRIEHKQIAGDVVECGVWRAGNIVMARQLAPSRVCWLYDTFAGMTEPTLLDRKPNGTPAIESYRRKTATRPWAAASLDEVMGYLQETGTYDETLLHFVVGPVEQTLLDPANVPECIALLRLDTDWYESTKAELEMLWPRLASGGVLIVDDYFHWMGARQAVDDYLGSIAKKRIDDAAILVIK